MARPSSLPQWATDAAAAITEPSAGKKILGWLIGEAPPAGYFNWWMNNAYLWLAWLSTLTFDAPIISSGVAGDDGSPVIDTTSAPTTYKLLWRIATGGSMYTRIYVRKTVGSSTVGGLTVTINAAWNKNTLQWDKDVGTERARRFDLAGQGNSTFDQLFGAWVSSTSAGSFADSTVGWGASWQLARFGKQIAWSQTSTGAGEANPASTDAASNILCPKNTCKSWGRISISAGAPTVSDGFNIASVTRPDATTIRVTFATAMQNATFAAVATAQTLVALILGKTTTYVDVVFLDPAAMGAGPKDISAFTGPFDLVVFGRQDS